MRVFLTKHAEKWVKKIGLKDSFIIKAIDEIQSGILDASLGSNLYKKRIASNYAGKRKSFRFILAFKKNDKIFFIYGFKKNSQANITLEELLALKKYGKYLLSLEDNTIAEMIKLKLLFEVIYEEKSKK